MLRSFFTVLFLFAIWLLMSGVYKPLIVILGLVSAIIAAFFVRRMDDAADIGRLELNLRPWELLKYYIWLMVEIAKANWAVTKVILSPTMPINQHYFRQPVSQKTDLGQTIFANSITLTPGTVTVDTDKNCFWVHALNFSDAVPDELVEMNRRVSNVEEGE